MTNPIVELATIRLAKGRSEADLLAASQTFQSEFLDGQDGFIRRELVRRAEGDYVDIIHWQSRKHADAVMAKIEGSEAVARYFSLMDFDPEKMKEAVLHCESVQVHTAPRA